MRRNVEKKGPEDPALQREAPSSTPKRLQLRAGMHIKPRGILQAQECRCRKVHCQTLPCLIRDPSHDWGERQAQGVSKPPHSLLKHRAVSHPGVNKGRRQF